MDDFHAFFFQKAWDTVGKDVTATCLQILKGSYTSTSKSSSSLSQRPSFFSLPFSMAGPAFFPFSSFCDRRRSTKFVKRRTSCQTPIAAIILFISMADWTCSCSSSPPQLCSPSFNCRKLHDRPLIFCFVTSMVVGPAIFSSKLGSRRQTLHFYGCQTCGFLFHVLGCRFCK